MKNYLLITAILFSLSHCKQNTENAAAQNSNDASPQLENLETCYKAVHGQDSVKLSLIYSAGIITGSLLRYHPQSGNSSTGTFTGTKSGDTLKLLSRTVTGGKISFSEIYLLGKADKLYEGTGRVEKINDSTTVFAEPSEIDFTNSFVYSKTDCNF